MSKEPNHLLTGHTNSKSSVADKLPGTMTVRSVLLNRDSPDIESRLRRRRNRTHQVRFKDLEDGSSSSSGNGGVTEATSHQRTGVEHDSPHPLRKHSTTRPQGWTDRAGLGSEALFGQTSVVGAVRGDMAGTIEVVAAFLARAPPHPLTPGPTRRCWAPPQTCSLTLPMTRRPSTSTSTAIQTSPCLTKPPSLSANHTRSHSLGDSVGVDGDDEQDSQDEYQTHNHVSTPGSRDESSPPGVKTQGAVERRVKANRMDDKAAALKNSRHSCPPSVSHHTEPCYCSSVSCREGSKRQGSATTSLVRRRKRLNRAVSDPGKEVSYCTTPTQTESPSPSPPPSNTQLSTTQVQTDSPCPSPPPNAKHCTIQSQAESPCPSPPPNVKQRTTQILCPSPPPNTNHCTTQIQTESPCPSQPPSAKQCTTQIQTESPCPSPPPTYQPCTTQTQTDSPCASSPLTIHSNPTQTQSDNSCESPILTHDPSTTQMRTVPHCASPPPPTEQTHTPKHCATPHCPSLPRAGSPNTVLRAVLPTKSSSPPPTVQTSTSTSVKPASTNSAAPTTPSTIVSCPTPVQYHTVLSPRSTPSIATPCSISFTAVAPYPTTSISNIEPCSTLSCPSPTPTITANIIPNGPTLLPTTAPNINITYQAPTNGAATIAPANVPPCTFVTQTALSCTSISYYTTTHATGPPGHHSSPTLPPYTTLIHTVSHCNIPCQAVQNISSITPGVPPYSSPVPKLKSCTSPPQLIKTHASTLPNAQPCATPTKTVPLYSSTFRAAPPYTPPSQAPYSTQDKRGVRLPPPPPPPPPYTPRKEGSITPGPVHRPPMLRAESKASEKEKDKEKERKGEMPGKGSPQLCERASSLKHRSQTPPVTGMKGEQPASSSPAKVCSKSSCISSTQAQLGALHKMLCSGARGRSNTPNSQHPILPGQQGCSGARGCSSSGEQTSAGPLTATQADTLRQVQEILGGLVSGARCKLDPARVTEKLLSPNGPLHDIRSLQTQLHSLEGVLETSQNTIKVLLDVIQDLEKKEAERDG